MTLSKGGGSGEKEAPNIKGNLVQALCEEEITWATFIKGLLSLNREEVSITFIMYRKCGESEEVYEVPPQYLTTLKELKRKNIAVNSSALAMSTSTLSRAWKDIASGMTATSKKDEPLGKSTFSQYLTEYVQLELDELKSRGLLENQTKSSVRARIQKRLSREELSWKAFINGLRILKVNYFKMTIGLKTTKGDAVNVTMKMNL